MKKLVLILAIAVLAGGVAYAATTQTKETATFALGDAQCTMTCVTDVITPTPPAPIPTPEPTPPSSDEIRFTAYVTGFSYWDNDPPGSTDIALPVIHDGAGGIGTYADPITVAVGWTGGRSYNPFYPKGTKFYFPHLKRYGIVEDLCASCTNGWLDIYVDGKTSSNRSADRCMNQLTGNYEVIKNPDDSRPVTVGVISSYNNCHIQ